MAIDSEAYRAFFQRLTGRPPGPRAGLDLDREHAVGRVKDEIDLAAGVSAKEVEGSPRSLARVGSVQ
jgi:hypothetical protein